MKRLGARRWSAAPSCAVHSMGLIHMSKLCGLIFDSMARSDASQIPVTGRAPFHEKNPQPIHKRGWGQSSRISILVECLGGGQPGERRRGSQAVDEDVHGW